MEPITDIVETVHLYRIKCNACLHYLSVMPVLISIENEENICGRCIFSKECFIHNKIFELLACQFLFPCMYANEGCINVTSLLNTKSHEFICSFRNYKCLCNWTGIPIDLKKHYIEQHTDLMITQYDTVLVQEELCFLFIHNNLHFCVHFKKKSDNHFTVMVEGLTEHDGASDARFICKLPDMNLVKKLELYKNVSIFFETLPLKVVLSSEISDSYVQSLLQSITCPNCLTLMAPPIIKCKNGHLTCVECCGMWLDQCSVCDRAVTFTCVFKLEHIATLIKFACKWNCGNQFDSTEIRYHEQICDERKYKCWFNCPWKGKADDLILHYTTCNANKYHQSSLLVNKNTVIFIPQHIDKIHYHLLVYKCRFELNIEFKNDKLAIFVSLNDVYDISCFSVSISMKYKAENYIFIKTYDHIFYRGGYFKLVFLEEETRRVRRDLSTKITISIKQVEEENRKVYCDELYKHFDNYGHISN